jgi:hypothetical protein
MVFHQWNHNTGDGGTNDCQDPNDLEFFHHIFVKQLRVRIVWGHLSWR